MGTNAEILERISNIAAKIFDTQRDLAKVKLLKAKKAQRQDASGSDSTEGSPGQNEVRSPPKFSPAKTSPGKIAAAKEQMSRKRPPVPVWKKQLPKAPPRPRAPAKARTPPQTRNQRTRKYRKVARLKQEMSRNMELDFYYNMCEPSPTMLTTTALYHKCVYRGTADAVTDEASYNRARSSKTLPFVFKFIEYAVFQRLLEHAFRHCPEVLTWRPQWKHKVNYYKIFAYLTHFNDPVLKPD